MEFCRVPEFRTKRTFRFSRHGKFSNLKPGFGDESLKTTISQAVGTQHWAACTTISSMYIYKSAGIHDMSLIVHLLTETFVAVV